jgi:hypothetical protein
MVTFQTKHYFLALTPLAEAFAGFGPSGGKFGIQMPASSIKSGEEHPCKRR